MKLTNGVVDGLNIEPRGGAECSTLWRTSSSSRVRPTSATDMHSEPSSYSICPPWVFYRWCRWFHCSRSSIVPSGAFGPSTCCGLHSLRTRQLILNVTKSVATQLFLHCNFQFLSTTTMLSWKTISLIVAAAIAVNGVVGLEQGYGGGIQATAPSTDSSNESPVQSPSQTTATPAVTTATSTESSTAQQTESEDCSQSTESPSVSSPGSQVEGSSASDNGSESGFGSTSESSSASDEGSDGYPGTTPPPDSSYRNSLSWDGSSITGGSDSFSGGKVTSGDGSIVYVDAPSETSDSSDGEHPGKGGYPTPSGSGSTDVSPPSGSGSTDASPPSGSGSIEIPPLSGVGSGSGVFPPGKGDEHPPSSGPGSDSDSTAGDDSVAGEASAGGEDNHKPPKGGCQVRRLRQ
ncbi:unnamed protein product [Phytophthora fragariaefolia]|uniref:Unnamed protein product n=1 Tax=Phytophthora fragariaefolia TaxID=1490495 RepID=A0A9W6Y158_9STRA|nr:unnamed protein product [Phytophthora fragariaefolia]